jgi:hypothetical protein
MSQLAACLAGSVHTGASTILCPPPEQTRLAMHKPIGLSERSRPEKNSALGVELAPVSAPPLVFYIDKQRLGRDCISEQLATHLSKWAIEPLASIRELPNDKDWSGLSLVILHTHGASLSTAEVTDEMNAIAETAPSVPLIVMSDLDDATEVHMGIQHGARGYLPAGLPFLQACWRQFVSCAMGGPIFQNAFWPLHRGLNGHHPLDQWMLTEVPFSSHRVNSRYWSDCGRVSRTR